MTKEEYLNEHLPVEELIDLGFFDESMTTDEKCERVCKFFGLKNIYMYHLLAPFGPDQMKPVEANIKTFSEN